MLLSYTSFTGGGQILTGGGVSGSIDGQMIFGVGGTTGMGSSGGPAVADPAPSFALASTTQFTGPVNDVFTYNGGVGSALSQANLVFAHQNAAASINVTAINPATTQSGISSPALSSGNPVGNPFNFSGTPSAVGTISFFVTLNDGLVSKTWTINFVIAATAPPQITSTAPTTGNVGSMYSYNVTMTGTPTPTLSVSGNPGWLTLSGNTLSGTPTMQGSYGPITLTATNGINPDAQQVFSINVGPMLVAPTITSTAPTTGITGQMYSYTVTATGFPTPTISVSGNPGWLTLSGNVLSGTPTMAGTYGPITITAANGVSPDDNEVFSIVVTTLTPPQITSTAPTTGNVGSLYTYNVTTTGSPTPTLSVSGNPAWLTLSGNTLSGTPTATGTYGPITLTATNGVNPDAQQVFSINVAQMLVAPTITSTPVTNAIVNVPYIYNITATGFPTPTLSVSGNPGWLTLSGNALSGTPPTAGMVPITITATNGVNPDGTQIFTINVAAGIAPVITSTPLTNATVGIPYTYTVTTSGMPNATITAMGLPTWLTLSAGTLSGTPLPVHAGTSANITITASNGVNPDATQMFTLQVSSPGGGGGGGGGDGGGCSADESQLPLLFMAGLLAVVLSLAVRKRLWFAK